MVVEHLGREGWVREIGVDKRRSSKSTLSGGGGG